MRYAKKSVMIPEEEYLALINMLKGDNYLQNERSLIDARIQQNLADSKLSPTIKSKRHDWLYKKRRQLKELEENRPQKVTIENIGAISNLAPYLGVTPPTIPKIEKQAEEAKKDVEKTVKIKAKRKRVADERVEESSADEIPLTQSEYSSAESEMPKSPPLTRSQTLFTAGDKLSPKNVPKLVSIIGKNREKFGVNSDGQIITNFGSAIKNSNFVDSLKYLSGELASPPKGFKFFLQKINKDPQVAKHFTLQHGKGRRVVVKVQKYIKTSGLKRVPKQRKFKPVIWAKL